MVKALAKDGDTIAEELTGEDCHLLHMAVGIIGEVAELVQAVTLPAPGSIDMINAVEEMGDIEFYLEGMSQGLEPYNMAVKTSVEVRVNIGYVNNVRYHATRLVGEAGDILDLVKKKAIYRKDLDVEKLLARLEIFRDVMLMIYTDLGITKAQAIDANIEKLGKRYAGLKYSDTAAQDRADKSA